MERNITKLTEKAIHYLLIICLPQCHSFMRAHVTFLGDHLIDMRVNESLRFKNLVSLKDITSYSSQRKHTNPIQML
jgi:hypothetical protein